MLQLSWLLTQQMSRLLTQQMSCLQPRLPPAVFVQQNSMDFQAQAQKPAFSLGFPSFSILPQAQRQAQAAPQAASRDAQLGPGGRPTKQEPFAGGSREKTNAP